VANRCNEQLNALASEFGLTPSSRTRVKAELPPEEEALEKKLFGPKTRVVKK
jgi:phage terminase small subunit